MKSLSVTAARELCASPRFLDWHRRYLELWQAIEAAHAAQPDPITHVVWRAGEYEERSAEAHARFVELDESFERLSEFEMQRQRTTELWAELHRAEKVLEDDRAVAAELRGKLAANRRGRPMTTTADPVQRQKDLVERERRLQAADAEVQAARARLYEAVRQREALWESVEAEWTQSFEANMARAEWAALARRAHGSLDGAPSLPPHSPGVNGTLHELEAAFEEHLQAVRAMLRCTVVREFLYWPSDEDIRGALCVALVDWNEHLNVQVQALQLYQVTRDRGIDFLEPVPPATESAEDPRLYEFFFTGRLQVTGAPSS